MDRNARSHHRQTLGGVQCGARRAQAVDYFNILTSPELLDITELPLQLPDGEWVLAVEQYFVAHTGTEFISRRLDRAGARSNG